MSGRSGPRASASARPSAWVREIVDASAVLTCVRQRRSRLGPKGLSDGQNTPGQTAGAPARPYRMPVKGAAQMGGEQLDPLQDAGLALPQKLVGLDAPEHVEFAGALVDRGANRQRHEYQAHAVRLVPIVETVLIEVEPAAVV